MFLTNDGDMTLEAGRTIEWQVRFERLTGTHTLDAPLEPGRRVSLSGAMGPYYTSAARACDASVG